MLLSSFVVVVVNFDVIVFSFTPLNGEVMLDDDLSESRYSFYRFSNSIKLLCNCVIDKLSASLAFVMKKGIRAFFHSSFIS